MPETYESRLLAFLRYRNDVKREMARLERTAVRTEDSQADLKVRREALGEFLRNQGPQEDAESYLLMPAENKPSGPTDATRTRFEQMKGLLRVLELHIRDLRSASPDVTEPESDEVLDDQTIKQLALLALEKWSPGQDIAALAEDVRKAYIDAKRSIGEANPGSAYEGRGILVL